MVPPRDPAALATALAKLMRNDALRSQMAAAGLAYARANFGLDAMLDKMEEIFYRCADVPHLVRT
jgi:glycosyltransferase involved in cell wall biosynthesis